VRALKILVVVMGVMLVVGFAALVAVIASRLAHRAPNAAAVGASAAGAPPFSAGPIDIPAGGRVETIGVGSDRMVIDVVLADGTRQLMIVDLATGRQLGLIPLRSAR
jgi:hypothetical protein